MFDELRSGRCEISRLLQYQVSNWSELGDDLVGTNFRQACAVVRSEGPSSGKTFRVNHWDLYLRLILESAEGLNPTHLEVYHNAGHQRISTSQCTLGQLMGQLNVHALWTLHCSVHWKFPAAKTQSRSHELCELQEASLQNKENHFKTNSHFNKREILAPKCCELRCSWAKVSIWGAESRQLQAQTIDRQLPSKKSKSSFVKEFKVLKKWIVWKCLEHVEPFGSLGSTDPQPLLLRTECQQYSSWMHGSAICVIQWSMIRPRFVSVRTAMTIAYTVERQTSIMGSKAMAHEFRKSLMTAAPQGLVSDGSYGNGLPHCYQIASNLRSIYSLYTVL